MENRKRVLLSDRNNDQHWTWMLTTDQIRLLNRMEEWLDDLDISWEIQEDSNVEVI